ncbi:dynein light chain LC6, flagellar outer arm [Benincasa hispida]|uniref:dynein light chain LC6, flagellar outer arm n=1 Tax=Benincasa hispida TaxID=102211 RepID=UPI0018FFD73F|nr:dynein light chain LC6, flagellar outer arm [Benincasa hispida]
MDGAEMELERRSKFLSGLILKKKAGEQQEQRDRLNVRVRASDMPFPLQNRAFSCARELLDSMPGKLDSKRLALALKKEFDSSYGPAWHCIVGTSFGSYVTHSLGGFLYFSIDKVYILLFKTAVEPLSRGTSLKD